MKLQWIHSDCLDTGETEGPAVFVFDDRQLARERWSLQRIGFVYECLLEMPEVEIFRGPMAETLGVLEAGGVLVEWMTPEPFVRVSGKVDLGRFSRYWRRAERELFR